VKNAVVPAIVLAAASLAVATSSQAQTHPEKPTYRFERCYGIARAGHNDCFTSAHACGNLSKVDGDPASWMYVPSGSCLKIVSGSLSEKK